MRKLFFVKEFFDRINNLHECGLWVLPEPHVGHGAFGEDTEIMERAHTLRVQHLPHTISFKKYR